MDTNQLVDQRDFVTAFLNWRDSETNDAAQEVASSYDFLMRNVSNNELNQFVASLHLEIARRRLAQSMQDYIKAIQFANSV